MLTRGRRVHNTDSTRDGCTRCRLSSSVQQRAMVCSLAYRSAVSPRHTTMPSPPPVRTRPRPCPQQGAAQLCCEQLLPVLQDLLNAYMGNWPVLAWALKVAKNVAKYEHTTYGTAASANGGSTSQAAQVRDHSEKPA